MDVINKPIVKTVVVDFISFISLKKKKHFGGSSLFFRGKIKVRRFLNAPESVWVGMLAYKPDPALTRGAQRHITCQTQSNSWLFFWIRRCLLMWNKLNQTNITAGVCASTWFSIVKSVLVSWAFVTRAPRTEHSVDQTNTSRPPTLKTKDVGSIWEHSEDSNRRTEERDAGVVTSGLTALK